MVIFDSYVSLPEGSVLFFFLQIYVYHLVMTNIAMENHHAINR